MELSQSANQRSTVGQFFNDNMTPEKTVFSSSRGVSSHSYRRRSTVQGVFQEADTNSEAPPTTVPAEKSSQQVASAMRNFDTVMTTDELRGDDDKENIQGEDWHSEYVKLQVLLKLAIAERDQATSELGDEKQAHQHAIDELNMARQEVKRCNDIITEKENACKIMAVTLQDTRGECTELSSSLAKLRQENMALESKLLVSTRAASAELGDMAEERHRLKDDVEQTHKEMNLLSESLAKMTTNFEKSRSEQGVAQRSVAVTSAACAESSNDVAWLRQKLGEARTCIAKLEGELATSQQVNHKLSSEVVQVRGNYADLQSVLDESETDHAAKVKAMAEVRSKLDQALQDSTVAREHTEVELDGAKRSLLKNFDELRACHDEVVFMREEKQREAAKAAALEVNLSESLSSLALARDTIARTQKKCQQLENDVEALQEEREEHVRAVATLQSAVDAAQANAAKEKACATVHGNVRIAHTRETAQLKQQLREAQGERNRLQQDVLQVEAEGQADITALRQQNFAMENELIEHQRVTEEGHPPRAYGRSGRRRKTKKSAQAQ